MEDNVLLTLEYDKILVGLGKHCASDLGKRMVTRLRPSDDIKEIEGWQADTEEAIEMILQIGNPPLFGITEIKSAVIRADKGGTLSPGQLLQIAESLRVSQALIDYVEEAEVSPLRDRISNLFTHQGLYDVINNAIQADESIADRASSTLYRIRRNIESKESQIKDKLNSIMNQAAQSGHLRENLITMREGRYVLPVKAESRRHMQGVVHDQSGSGATYFIEPLAIVNLNNEIRQLEGEEQEEISRILKSLSQEVADFAEPVASNQDHLQFIDFTFGKAKYALKMGGIRPTMTDDRVTNIHQARHPLLGENVVPINIELGDTFNTLIITGPNTGGKTVTLKTLGLLTVMAQSGLQIPAKAPSKVGVYSNVYADIGDKQSIEMSLSTFSASMTNIIDILEKADPTSLILFDELGAGTDPTEGAALAMSILAYLTDHDIRTVATTHYSELKLFAIREKLIQNASVEFDVESLSPTYKLTIGLPGRSNAFDISRRLGLSENILESAQNHLASENIHFEDVLHDIEESRKRAETDQANMERLRSDYEIKLKKMKDELERAQENHEKQMESAKAEARDIILEAQVTAQKLIREAKQASKGSTQELDRTLTSIREQVQEEEGKLAPKVPQKKKGQDERPFRMGETVEIVSMAQRGSIIDGPDRNGDVLIQMGILKVNSNVKDLIHVEEDKSVQSKHSSPSKILEQKKSMDISMELDLRGQRYEEALDIVDKYLDDAILAGLHVVRLIHGKGTGALRQGVTEFLRKDSRVAKYQLADEKEGGAGVTVVELK